MPKHIKPYDNKNKPIIDINDEMTPLVYHNTVRLKKGENYTAQLEEYESAYVLATGTCDIEVDGELFRRVGNRNSLWDGKPDSVYAPLNAKVKLTGISEHSEILVAGGKIDKRYEAFRIPPEEVGTIQYGSDDTKTHRRIQHVLGHNAEGRSGRLLVSELFTVGAGGWSGFPPHKHDEDRPPIETRFEEVYQFRFKPEWGFGAQFAYVKEEDFGPVYHLKDRSVISLDYGYHPCVAAPGYEMYYFTIIVGETHRALIQYFQPAHEYQVHTIPGIKDMVAGFK